jgi:hypothetical protein
MAILVQSGEHVVITTQNLAKGKPIHASSYPDAVGPDQANDSDFRSSWYLDETQTSGWLEVDLKKQESFNTCLARGAATFIVPASVGQYTISPIGRSVGKTCATIKAFVRWE